MTPKPMNAMLLLGAVIFTGFVAFVEKLWEVAG